MSHRKPLLNQLGEYRRRYPGEADTLSRFLAFVSAHEDCFLRSQALGHITASAWLLDPECGSVLLTHHRKLNRWLQPGGHADGDPDALATALREAREESGIADIVPLSSAIFDLDIHPIPARAHEPAHLHYDVRFLLQAQQIRYVVSAESHDLAWVKLHQVRDYNAENSILRMADKWQHRAA